MDSKLTPEVTYYLNELAADIAANGGFENKSVEEAIQAAHQRRRDFAMEMAVGSTGRAQMARKGIQASVWHGAQVIAAKERLAMQAKDSTRGFLLACESIDSK